MGSEAWKICARKKRSGVFNKRKGKHKPDHVTGEMVTQKICPGVQLGIKGWCSSENIGNKEGNDGLQPKDDPSWLGPNSESLKEGGQIASDEAQENIQCHNILSETIIFHQSWVYDLYNKELIC